MTVAQITANDDEMIITTMGVYPNTLTGIVLEFFGSYNYIPIGYKATTLVFRKVTGMDVAAWRERVTAASQEIETQIGLAVGDCYKIVTFFEEVNEKKASEVTKAVNKLHGCHAVLSATTELVEVYCYGGGSREEAVKAMAKCLGNLVATKRMAGRTLYQFKP